MKYTRIQRSTALFLAALLLAGNLMQFSFYAFALNQVKNKMKMELFTSSGDFTTMNLTQDQFAHAKVNGGEMCINGNWYDISSIVAAGNGVKVKCLADNDESVLNSWMKKVVNDHGSDNGKQKNTLSVNSEYIPSASCIPVSTSDIALNDRIVNVVNDVIPGFHSLPELPPRA